MPMKEDLETADDLCEDADAVVEEAEEDIAGGVLHNIWKMAGVEKTIQAQNIFKIDGKKTVVRISNKGLTIFYKKSLSCFSTENK